MDRLVQAFGGEPKHTSDLLDILRDARRRELVDADSLAMIEGVFEVADMQVRDIMIPRGQMVVVEEDAPLQEILPVIISSGHSRFPVIGESRDEVVGMLLAKDLLRYTDDDASEFKLDSLLRKPVFTPESKRLNVLLKEFRANRNHMAIVVDEYGGVAGLVTIEDVLEEIVGEIDDEHDQQENVHIRPLADGRYSVRALTPIDEFNEMLGADFSDDEFDTVGGLVMQQIGHMPRPGETTELGGFRFKVLSAEKRRIHLLQVRRIDSATDDDAVLTGN
jgi:magnesium and cobalt transporter